MMRISHQNVGSFSSNDYSNNEKTAALTKVAVSWSLYPHLLPALQASFLAIVFLHWLLDTFVEGLSHFSNGSFFINDTIVPQDLGFFYVCLTHHWTGMVE